MLACGWRGCGSLWGHQATHGSTHETLNTSSPTSSLTLYMRCCRKRAARAAAAEGRLAAEGGGAGGNPFAAGAAADRAGAEADEADLRAEGAAVAALAAERLAARLAAAFDAGGASPGLKARCLLLSAQLHSSLSAILVSLQHSGWNGASQVHFNLLIGYSNP